MKKLALILCVLALGCAKAENKLKPQPPEATPPAVQETEKAPTLDKNKTYSSHFIKGYNDGFNGNWLAPINWLFANEYRSGWSAGNRDMRHGNPHFFNSQN
jgi:hypothetical protein